MDAATIIQSIDLTAPFPYGAVSALLPASVIHRRGPAGEIATVVAAAPWFLNPVAGVVGVSIGFAIATWFSGKNRGRDWRTAVLAAFPPSAFIWALAWADPERWGDLSATLAHPYAGLALYAATATAVTLAARALQDALRPALDPKRRFDAKQRQQVIDRWGNRCAYCSADGDAPGVRLEIDHIVPHSRGGRTESTNGMPLCPPCNSLKGDLSDKEARRRFHKVNGYPAGSRGLRRWVALRIR